MRRRFAVVMEKLETSQPNLFSLDNSCYGFWNQCKSQTLNHVAFEAGREIKSTFLLPIKIHWKSSNKIEHFDLEYSVISCYGENIQLFN